MKQAKSVLSVLTKSQLVKKAEENSRKLATNCDLEKSHNVWYVGSEDLIYTNDMEFVPENGQLFDSFEV